MNKLNIIKKTLAQKLIDGVRQEVEFTSHYALVTDMLLKHIKDKKSKSLLTVGAHSEHTFLFKYLFKSHRNIGIVKDDIEITELIRLQDYVLNEDVVIVFTAGCIEGFSEEVCRLSKLECYVQDVVPHRGVVIGKTARHYITRLRSKE